MTCLVGVPLFCMQVICHDCRCAAVYCDYGLVCSLLTYVTIFVVANAVSLLYSSCRKGDVNYYLV